MSSLAKIPKRWRVLGGNFIVLLLAYIVLVHWWFTVPMWSMASEIRSLGQEELKLRMEATQRSSLEKSLAQVKAFEDDNPGFLSEANRELASAGLVQRLEQVVGVASQNPNACQITARTPVETPTKELFERVAVQVRLRCGMGELAAVLHSLEGNKPQLFIDNLNIMSRRNYMPPGVETSNALEISFDLYGYIKSTPGGSGG